MHTCTSFKWWRQAIMKFLCKANKCDKKTCVNYDSDEGDACSCDKCRNCMIFELKNISAYDLLDNLL